MAAAHEIWIFSTQQFKKMKLNTLLKKVNNFMRRSKRSKRNTRCCDSNPHICTEFPQKANEEPFYYIILHNTSSYIKKRIPITKSWNPFMTR